jgi:hypothetical protein
MVRISVRVRVRVRVKFMVGVRAKVRGRDRVRIHQRASVLEHEPVLKTKDTPNKAYRKSRKLWLRAIPSDRSVTSLMRFCERLCIEWQWAMVNICCKPWIQWHDTTRHDTTRHGQTHRPKTAQRLVVLEAFSQAIHA